MTPEFIRGAWFAWDEVLAWINTLDTQTVDKADLYRQVMQLRPERLTRAEATLGRVPIPLLLAPKESVP